MATRRMFSSRITESTRFLKMPVASQNLYFHLGMHADDDGVVEAYPVMRIIGATDDDLNEITSKGFATLLNDDMVVFLNDWIENNNIRADRKTDSIYKDLLLKVVPDAKLKETKHACYSRNDEVCQTSDRQMTDKRKPNGGIGKVRLGKDSIGKDSIGKGRIDNFINYQLIADMYNDICVSFPKLTKLSESRKKAIKARLKTYTVEDFKKMFQLAESSSFLKGQNERNWSATFDWMLKDANMAKILDGNYLDKDGRQAAVEEYELPDYYPKEPVALTPEEEAMWKG